MTSRSSSIVKPAISCSAGTCDRTRAALPGIGQSLDELPWRDDRNADILELEQIAMADHERLDDRHSRERDETVVAGVSTDRKIRPWRIRSHRLTPRRSAT